MLIPFNELFTRHRIKVPGVLHLGANTGQEAKAYDALGIQKVIWVEALPDLHAALRRNVSAYSGHVPLCACLGSRDGDEVTFNVASNGGQSSSYLKFGTHAQEHPDTTFVRQISMKTVRVDTLLKEHKLTVGPGWFLNVDLQGAELMAMEGMGVLMHEFNHAYIEVNVRELYEGCPLIDEIDDFMREWGFEGKETLMMRQGWGDKYYERVQSFYDMA